MTLPKISVNDPILGPLLEACDALPEFSWVRRMFGENCLSKRIMSDAWISAEAVHGVSQRLAKTMAGAARRELEATAEAAMCIMTACDTLEDTHALDGYF